AVLRERAAEAASNDADIETVRSFIDPAIAWHREQGDRTGVARTSTLLGMALTNDGQPIAAAAVLEAAVLEAADLESEPAVVRLLTELSRAYAIVRDSRALELADRAIAAAERLELIPSVAEALVNRALALGFAGRSQEPIAILRGVIPLTEAHGLIHTRLRAGNNLSANLWAFDPRAAHAMNDELIDLARRNGIRGWLAQFLQGGVGSAVYVGEWADADRLIAEIDRDELTPSMAVSLGESEALLFALRGDAARARSTLTGLEPFRGLFDDPRAEGWRHQTLAIIDSLGGSLDQAFAAGMRCAGLGLDNAFVGAEWAARAAIWSSDARRARQALDAHLARPERGPVVAADRRVLGAGVRALEGDRAGALADYRAAIAAYRDLRLPLHLGMSVLDFATLIGPDVPDARAAADEAREIFTRLGSPPLLVRLGAGLARWTTSGVRAEEHAARPVASG
ncbi:MAG: ATP-binding protein, partial [Candidatus Limnocylindrales bacterium]